MKNDRSIGIPLVVFKYLTDCFEDNPKYAQLFCQFILYQKKPFILWSFHQTKFTEIESVQLVCEGQSKSVIVLDADQLSFNVLDKNVLFLCLFKNLQELELVRDYCPPYKTLVSSMKRLFNERTQIVSNYSDDKSLETVLNLDFMEKCLIRYFTFLIEREAHFKSVVKKKLPKGTFDIDLFQRNLSKTIQENMTAQETQFHHYMQLMMQGVLMSFLSGIRETERMTVASTYTFGTTLENTFNELTVDNFLKQFKFVKNIPVELKIPVQLFLIFCDSVYKSFKQIQDSLPSEHMEIIEKHETIMVKATKLIDWKNKLGDVEFSRQSKLMIEQLQDIISISTQQEIVGICQSLIKRLQSSLSEGSCYRPNPKDSVGSRR